MLVIAKYKEDIGWSEGLERKVYDKGAGIPNVGREAETYLRYIVEHYDNLPDIVTFCQGDPFDHVPDFLDIYNKEGFMGLDHNTNYDNCPHHPELDVKGFAKEIDIELPPSWLFKAGAQFTFKKETILKYDLDFYKKLREFSITKDGPWILERLWVHIFKLK